MLEASSVPIVVLIAAISKLSLLAFIQLIWISCSSLCASVDFAISAFALASIVLGTLAALLQQA